LSSARFATKKAARQGRLFIIPLSPVVDQGKAQKQW
jgi:hypothetical protein